MVSCSWAWGCCNKFSQKEGEREVLCSSAVAYSLLMLLPNAFYSSLKSRLILKWISCNCVFMRVLGLFVFFPLFCYAQGTVHVFLNLKLHFTSLHLLSFPLITMYTFFASGKAITYTTKIVSEVASCQTPSSYSYPNRLM